MSAELWFEVWEIIDALRERGYTIRVHKVKAHTTEVDIANGIITHEHRKGNDIANHWGGKRAEINQLSEINRRGIDLIDSQSWCIQRRVLAICHEFHSETKKEPREEPCPVDRSKLNEEILELGHAIQVEKGGPNAVYKCGHCCQTWTTKTKRVIIDQGRCQGPGLWKGLNTSRPDRPQVAEAGCDILFHGQKLDRSHTFAWWRGVILQPLRLLL